MHTLDQFFNHFKQGFQRPNRFEAFVIAPRGFIERSAKKNELIEVANWLERGVTINATSLPSRSLDVLDHYMYGVTERVPIYTEFAEQSCTFFAPLTARRDNAVHRFFTEWQNYIHHMDGDTTTRDLRFTTEYYGRLEIHLFADQTTAASPSYLPAAPQSMRTAIYEFTNAYPKTVESVRLDWNNTNEVMTFDVSFLFTQWSLRQ